jgi:hypothetical protein
METLRSNSILACDLGIGRGKRRLALPIALAAAALLLLGAASEADAATTNYPASTFQLTVQSPTDASEVITFSGPTAILDSLNSTGAAADTDGNGLDQATTQITGLTLTGTSTTLGLGLGTMHLVPAPSLGGVEETVNSLPGILDVQPYAASGSANSFFDVFFQLDFSSATLHNGVAEHVASALNQWPPHAGNAFTTQGGGIVDLLDANGSLTGYRITSAIYIPGTVPEPSTLLLLSCGLVGLAGCATYQARSRSGG